MAKTHTRKESAAASDAQQLDSVYFLKLVLYIIVGSQWLRFIAPAGGQVPIPVGFLIGMLFALHDHFRIDRKIEFAVLLVAMLVGFWTQMGLYVHVA